jgi:glycosyltransferase involved in cell wall biosynthesis
MALARAGLDIPLVATIHTSHFLTRAEKRFWRPILGRLVRTPDYTLAASQEIAKVAMGLAPGVEVEALANGVETDVFRRIEPTLQVARRPRILVPRRLFQKNGVEFFVRALPEILESVDVEAVFVGDGPEGPRLKALVGELGIANRVTFLGKQDHSSMPGILSSGDLAVIPSLMEATSVAALESMACELPVLASNVGGLPEIIDDSVGGLFEPGNPKALARAVIEILAAGNLPELGRAARCRVKELWSNDRLADRHLEIYSDLLEMRGRA